MHQKDQKHSDNPGYSEQETTLDYSSYELCFFSHAVRIYCRFYAATLGELLIVSHFHFYIENVDCKIYYIIHGSLNSQPLDSYNSTNAIFIGVGYNPSSPFHQRIDAAPSSDQDL